jgi:hypothetical protein
MAASSSNFSQMWGGGLTDGRGAGWMGLTNDSTATAAGTGYLAGMMRGSRGSVNLGISTGDVVFLVHGTTAFTAWLVTGSTINQASTNASSSYNYAFDGTLTALTAL